jgi:hypothetical protein
MVMLEKFSTEIASATPELEKLGFQVETFKLQMLPPTGKLRLVSRSDDGLAVASLEIPPDASLLVRTILMSATAAKSIQKILKLELVIMDVDVGSSNTINLSYLKKEGDTAIAMKLVDLAAGCSE